MIGGELDTLRTFLLVVAFFVVIFSAVAVLDWMMGRNAKRNRWWG